MKLTKKQTIWLLNDSGLFSTFDICKTFDTFDVDWLTEQKFVIKPSTDMPDWYDLFMNGEKYTSLNFRTYPEKLDYLKNISH